MYDVILSFITSFTLTFFAIPSIIHVAKRKKLFDEPNERRIHKESTPSLGGIAIFAGVLFSITLWTPFSVFGDLQYILCAFIIIFLIGAKDDILPMKPYKKVLGEVLAAGILVLKSNVEVTSLYGFFGIYEVPTWVSIPLSIFIIVVIINAFNLIDGINGLSGSIAVLISLVLGSWFFLIGHLEIAIIAFALIGSVSAFLYYNVTPAKIFMGDTGSLFIGLVCSILTLKFIDLHNELETSQYYFTSVPAVAIGVLILPLFDTFRVFITRILKGRSPFAPDRNHIHHLMIDVGFSHMQATLTLLLVNILFIFVVYQFQHLGNFRLLIVILVLASLLTSLLLWFRRRKYQIETS